MASDTQPFALTRCTVDDMEEILELQYKSFAEDIRRIIMGCHSPADLPNLREKYVTTMRESPHDIWIAVRDTETGKIIGASDWRVFANGEGGARDVHEAPEWLEGEELEVSKSLTGQMNDTRAKNLPGPFVHLHICFTHPDYRRRGAGGMMLQWGCDLADQLFLPSWIEASDEGNFLYKAFGFYDYGKIGGSFSGMTMKRDARTKPIVGGKRMP